MPKNKFNKPCPTVNALRKTIDVAVSLQETDRQTLINLLEEYRNGHFYTYDAYDITFNYQRPETNQEYDLRIKKEHEAVNKWQEEYNAFLQYQEEQHQKVKEEKKEKNKKYQDPEYVEFLRMKARMQSKGYVDNDAQ